MWYKLKKVCTFLAFYFYKRMFIANFGGKKSGK